MLLIRALSTAAALVLLTTACGATAPTAGPPQPCPAASPMVSSVARTAPTPLARVIATGSAVAHSGAVITATSGRGPYAVSPAQIATAQAEAQQLMDSMPSRYPTTPIDPHAGGHLGPPLNPPTNASASTTSTTTCAPH